MTNLKKTLAVVLAFAMILSMGAISTFAYSDVEDGTTVSEAVTVLSNLDIITGYEDGTFRPDETVTRAQMAAIICRLLGYEDQAQSSMGTTVFNDVAADHWAAGYVNVTQAQGIINGYGDGNFGPEDKVTYEQAVKMIVSALGYDLAAARKGGYPTGYLAIASSEGITKKAGGKVGDAAARSSIAVLVFNALDVQLMDQNVWATDGSDEFGKRAETVLTKHHGIYKYRGVVTATPVVAVADAASYKADSKFGIFLDNAQELIYSANDLPRWSYLMEDDDYVDYYAEDAKVDVNPYLGKAVIIYAGEDQETGDETVYSITEDGSKNSSLKISATQLVDDGNTELWDVDNTVGYKEVGAKKSSDLSLDADVLTFVNYDVVGAGINTTAEIAAYFVEGFGGTIEFVSNDADNAYEVINIIAYDDEAVIESVETDEGVLVYELYTGNYPSEIDPEDEDSLVIVYKDGELATVADLAENDTVNHIEVTENFDMYFASSKTVEGEVEGYYEEGHMVTINGEDYELSVNHECYKEEDVYKLNGEEGIFFLNADGQIAHSETDPTALGNYAIVLAAYKATGGLNKGAFLQVVLADGTLAEYKIGDRAKIVNDEKVTVAENKAGQEYDVYNYFAPLMTQDMEATDEVYRATVNDLLANDDLMAKVTISNNKITRIKLFAAGTTAVEDDITKKYDAEAKSIGNIDLDDNTVVFSVKQTEGIDFVEGDDIVIGNVNAFFSDEEVIGGVVKTYDEDDKSSIYGAAVGFGVVKSIKAKSDLFVVTGKRTKSIDDAPAYVLSGIIGGEKASITVYDEAEEYTTDPDAVTVGDVLLVSEIDGEGFAKDIQLIVDYYYKKGEGYSFDGVYASETAIEDDEIFAGFGLVTASESNKFAIDGDIMLEDEGAYVDHEDNIAAGALLSYRSSATYTLVDFTDSKSSPDVATKKGNKSLFNIGKYDEDGNWVSGGYDSYAYVRYVDGKMAEVIVFRMDKKD